MRNKTVLAVGDHSPDGILASSSFERFVAHKKLLSQKSTGLKTISYKKLLGGYLPEIKAKKIIVMLFFPYQYWDENIEKYTNHRIYGDDIFGQKFEQFFARVNQKLEEGYKDKKLYFINSPESIRIDRDKKLTKELLRRGGVPTPTSYNVKSPRKIITLLNKGVSLYIKPRYGALGKGITYLTKGEWRTNFLFKRGKIISLRSDYGWTFNEVTGKRNFLERLLQKGVIVERAIDLPVIEGRKFDLRIYVIFGKIPYLYARSAPLEKIVTNWSQGGQIEDEEFLKKIPHEKLVQAKQYAIKAAKIMGLNFAGMDIIFSHDYKKIFVLEGHSFPGYETRFNLFNYLIDHLSPRQKNKKSA